MGGWMGYHGAMMRSEQDLVPYTTGRLDGSPVLVMAPHPDDEVFGCGGVIAQAVRSGASVRVVVLTDGAAQGDPATRRAEALEAAHRLGVGEPEFWGLADRSLCPDDPDLINRVRSLLVEAAPNILLLPSPAEIHPDHRALALLVYGVIQSATPGDELQNALQATRLATYEVSAVLRPNLLVDVSAEWETVLSAADAYASQLEKHAYVEVMDGIAQARCLTLPRAVRRAEAYHVVDPRYIRSHSATEWAAAQGPIVGLESAVEAAPLDVVVRTRNRPQLLLQALDSIALQLHPPRRVIVVNDGGESVAEICGSWSASLEIDPVLIELDESRGRAGAAQVGLESATAPHIVFLDDDDLMYPDHLLALGQAIARGVLAPYVDAVQGHWRTAGDGQIEQDFRHRTFGGDFDAARFELLNHIPLPCIAIPRELALDVGGFDSELDLYEDWDLLLRLVRRTPLTYVPKVTCEYRMIEGSGEITGANPPGSPGQLAALQKIWRRHGLLADGDRLAAAVMSLVAARDRASEHARIRDEELVEARGARDGVEAELRRVRREGERLATKIEDLKDRLSERDGLAAEVTRLNAVLEMVYASRTWRLKEFLNSLLGRSQKR